MLEAHDAYLWCTRDSNNEGLRQRRAVQILLANYGKTRKYRSEPARSGPSGQFSVLQPANLFALPFSEIAINIVICFATTVEGIEQAIFRVLTSEKHSLVQGELQFTSKSRLEVTPR